MGGTYSTQEPGICPERIFGHSPVRPHGADARNTSATTSCYSKRQVTARQVVLALFSSSLLSGKITGMFATIPAAVRYIVVALTQSSHVSPEPVSGGRTP
jgi:hypothetical protein